VFAQFPSALDGFDPNVDGNVYVLASQADGKLLVGGQFSTVQGYPRNNLARLNADGSIDHSFDPSPNGPVRAIALQPDGRIVFGGDFVSLQPGGAGTPIGRGRIARVSATGAADAFNPNVGGELQPQVYALAIQPNGQIVAGGSFTTAHPNAPQGTPTARNYLARFNADGTLDAGFNPSPNGMVLALASYVGNMIVVGGGFTTVGGEERSYIARLNPGGTVDSEFIPNANNGVTCLTVQRDGKILLGGYFTTLQPPINENPASHAHIARLNPNGTLDAEFYPRVEGNVSAIAVQPDGAILVGGNFSAVWGRGANSASRSHFARFNSDGSLDDRPSPTLNSEVRAVAIQGDGKVVIGGHFTRAIAPGATIGLVRNRLARLDANGSLDANFELNPGGRILTSVTQADGRIVVGGTFTNIGGAARNYVARLNADGTVDATYNPNFNAPVYSLAYEAGGNKVIAAGAFTTVSVATRNRLARLNPDGTVDADIYPVFDGQIGVVLPQPDGRLLVGGTFARITPVGATEAVNRSNFLRLNANGTLDTAFDPAVNSSVSVLTLQSDGKILLAGAFTAIAPGASSNTSSAATSRAFIARVNADGTLDPAFNPNPNGSISAMVVQADGKIVMGGAFTGLNPNGAAAEHTTRNRIARLNADGTLDEAYNPNADGNVLALALQADGRILAGGTFIFLQPNNETTPTLRKYAARLNADGTVDPGFNLDIGEQRGNRVDSIRVQADGRVMLGGNFATLHAPNTPARLNRRNFARILPNGTVDPAFDVSAGGSTAGIVNALALQADGGVIAGGSFTDLGGARSTNIARFRPEGTADSNFNPTLTTDGPVNAIIVRPDAAPTPTQLGGLAWLNANGTLRTAFATGTTRLSGEINAVAVQADGRILLGGTFTNLANTTGPNLVRFNANGMIDTSFNPNPNGTVTGIALYGDGRILIVGAFQTVGGALRNRIARLDSNGSLDTTFDPSASGRINAVVMQGNGSIVIGGAFTSLTPNFVETPVTRNYMARINQDGTVDTTYNPSPNFNVNTLALQEDGKVVAGGGFTTVAPNGVTEVTARSAIARFNVDGTVDPNFIPNANGLVNTVVALPNGQFLVGGSFSSFNPYEGGNIVTRNNLARINSDGTVDPAFNPNPNGPVSTLAVQPNGQVLVGGTFTTLQPGATGAALARNNFARLDVDGATVDPNFNPDINGSVSAILPRPDGTVIVSGKFNTVQLSGSILVGGDFGTIGGVAARNLASLNDNGSVNPNFQPRPDGAVSALIVQTDGKTIVGGEFTNIAGVPRNRIARFNADGSLDTAFNPGSIPAGSVRALALQTDGKVLIGLQTGGLEAMGKIARLNPNGSVDATFAMPLTNAGAVERVTGLAIQPDGRILALTYSQIAGNTWNTVQRLTPSGAIDGTFAPATLRNGSIRAALSLQADGRLVVAGAFTTVNGVATANLARLYSDGVIDPTFNPAPNAAVTALALQSDGRVMIGGQFTAVGGILRVGLARLAATDGASQTLGVSANRASVVWSRNGTVGELSGAIFEYSADRIAWTRLGEGRRVAGGANWQLGGLNLPAAGNFLIRVRGIVPTSAGSSSGIYEMAREFTFSSPVQTMSSPIATLPATGAAPMIDNLSGIMPRAAITVVPGEGSVEIFVPGDASDAVSTEPARLANLSTRGRVTADSPLILGFAIAGADERRVLVRAVGPALDGFGVAGALPATRLHVYDAAGTLLAANEGWGNSAELTLTAATTGAFPLTPGSADSVAAISLAPGNYTIQVIDPRGVGGVALAEIYDAGTGAGSRLVNVSSRGAAGVGGDALISGFVVAGGAAQRVLLRGVGPGLAQFTVGTVATDPSIALFDAIGRELGSNDNWVASVPQISTAAAQAGAFALTGGSRDAAVLATLPAGAYTVHVSSGSGNGAALLEIYDLR